MPPKKTDAVPAMPHAPAWVRAEATKGWGGMLYVAGSAALMPTGESAVASSSRGNESDSYTAATGDPGIVVRFTSDAHEAGFSAAMLHEDEQPPGFPRVLAVVRLTGRLRDRRTFGIWREALAPNPPLPTWERDGPFRRHLATFSRAAEVAMKGIRASKDIDAFTREAWRTTRSPQGHVTPEQLASTAALDATLRALSGVRRVAVALSAARLSARALERTPGGELAGAGLGFWLDRGMLLEGLDGRCLGMAKRGTLLKAIIAEPGRPYLLDGRYGVLEIPPLADAAPIGPQRRRNPARSGR